MHINKRNVIRVFLLLVLFFIIKISYARSQVLKLKSEFLNLKFFPDECFFYAYTPEGKSLLYYKEGEWTSFTTLTIDDFPLRYSSKAGKFIQPFEIEENEITGIWESSKIRIYQKIRLNKTPFSDQTNAVEVTYRIENRDKVVHKVGLRILLDTCLGKVDGAPFRVPGYGVVTTETILSKNKIPEYLYTYPDLKSPELITFLYLSYKDYEKPYKIIFACPGRIGETLWNYKIDKELGFKKGLFSSPDSAIALYWKPVKLNPGESRNIKFAYGLLPEKPVITDYLSVLISNPLYIEKREFITGVDVQNITITNTIKNFSISIMPEDNLNIEKSKVTYKSIKPAQIKTAFFKINLKNDKPGKYYFKIKIKGKVLNKEIDLNYRKYVIYKKAETIEISQKPEKITNIQTNIQPVKKIISKEKAYSKWKIVNYIENKAITNFYIKIDRDYSPAVEIKSNEIKIVWKKTLPPEEKITEETIGKAKPQTNIIEADRQFVYYIQKGETLSEIIARILKLHTGWKNLVPYIKAIAEYNMIKNENLIYESDYIYFPCLTVQTTLTREELAKIIYNDAEAKDKIIVYKREKEGVISPGDTIILKDIHFLRTGQIKD